MKVLSRKTASFQQLLSYCFHEKDREKRKGKGFVIRYNVRGRIIKHMAKSFLDNEKNRINLRKDSTLLQHVVLSFSPKSGNISAAVLEDLTRKFIELRNPNGMYVALPHKDKDHIHVHIVQSAIEHGTGKSMRMPPDELHKLKVALQEYQIEKYPELEHSIVRHGSRKTMQSDREYRLKERKVVIDKDIVLQILDTAFRQARSADHFYDTLRSQGYEIYIRGGKRYGIVFNDRKYRFGTLGYSPEKIAELDQRQKRRYELKNTKAKTTQQRIKTK